MTDGDENNRPRETWFGSERVAWDEKKGRVRGVFDSVAGRYDLMNDLMSGGVHRLWKRTLIDRIEPRPGMRLVDVAGGTGDIAFGFLAAAERWAHGPRAPGVEPEARVTLCDINETMVSVGRDRAVERGFVGGIDWVVGDAEALPIADGAADVYSIAFGLRNVTDIDAALGEARRVLRPGGRFYCLEFSRVVLPVIDRLYALYSDAVLPALGQMVAGDAESYRYLVESIRRFPDQPALAQRIEAAGLAVPRWRNLTGGVAAIHSAWRP